MADIYQLMLPTCIVEWGGGNCVRCQGKIGLETGVRHQYNHAIHVENLYMNKLNSYCSISVMCLVDKLDFIPENHGSYGRLGKYEITRLN